ncbi:MAG: hypothetical protein HGB10_08745 [Coriobacteriia bacterium]|nr:hypothetical protein [Coriobacteriia bacterium]
MRQLTFEGYLKSYVGYLADSRSSSPTRLWACARTHPRVVEPLLLFAVVSGRSGTLLPELESKPHLSNELQLLEKLHDSGALESALGSEDSQLRPEYRKVWRSYVVRRDAHLRDADLKRVARERVLELEPTRHVSRYQMAKSLGLNPGNLHAFLAQGNVAKLSLDRAYALVGLLSAAQ